MSRQADGLRRLGAHRPFASDLPDGPPTIVVGSGKGGAGKSLVTLLLAAALAERGRRVLVVEGDCNRASLHLMVGVQRRGRMADLLLGGTAPASLLTPVTERISLLPGDSGEEQMLSLGPIEHARLLYRIAQLYDDFDVVLVDGGPGIDGTVRAVTTRATRLLLVALPEAAALSDSYALAKLVHAQAPNLPIDVLVNRVATPGDGPNAYLRLRDAARQFLGRELGTCGWFLDDDAVRTAARTPEPLLAGALERSTLAVATRRLLTARADMFALNAPLTAIPASA